MKRTSTAAVAVGDINQDDTTRLTLADLPDTLTVSEAGKVLRLGRNSVYEGIKRSEIPAIKIGRRLLVPKAGIERLLRGAA